MDCGFVIFDGGIVAVCGKEGQGGCNIWYGARCQPVNAPGDALVDLC